MADKKITRIPDGPLKVEGDIPLVDTEGNAVPTREGAPYFLCRCGASQNKPFCDGTHKRVEFSDS